MIVPLKRAIASFVVGALIASLPFVFERLVTQLPGDGYLQSGLGFLMLPGLILGVIVSGGNVHTYSLSIVEVSNFLFYGALTYVALGKLSPRGIKPSAGAVSGGPSGTDA